jgi:ribosomal protein S18 acetylase RimI-like enzyme
MPFAIAPLTPATWPAFEALALRNNGVWGGCWCMSFHPEGLRKADSPDARRAMKRARVDAGMAHAALVLEGADCLGWCQFGPPAELTRIKHRKSYEAGGGAGEGAGEGAGGGALEGAGGGAVCPVQPPDWRITCLFVDKTARGRGVAEAALHGALGLIAAAGGGVVETMPEDAAGRKTSGSFLWNGEAAMFDRAGFERVRKLGKHVWLMRKAVGGL